MPSGSLSRDLGGDAGWIAGLVKHQRQRHEQGRSHADQRIRPQAGGMLPELPLQPDGHPHQKGGADIDGEGQMVHFTP